MAIAQARSPADAVRSRGPAPTDLQRESCPLCGTRDLQACVELPHNRLLKCRQCGLCSTEGWGSAEAVAQYYSEHRAHLGKATESDGQLPAIAAQQAESLLAITAQTGPGRILELGCAAGHLLQQMQGRGWQCWGIDLSRTSLADAATRVEAHLHRGTIDDFEPPLEGFDCIAAFDILAHLVDPVATISRAAQMLRPGGWLILSTVNEGWPLVPVFRRLFAAMPVRTADLRDEMYEGQHYCYFNEQNIQQLLRLAGLEWFETRPLPPLSASHFKHQYPLPKRLAFSGMLAVDRLLGSSRKMLVSARRPLER